MQLLPSSPARQAQRGLRPCAGRRAGLALAAVERKRRRPAWSASRFFFSSLFVFLQPSCDQPKLKCHYNGGIYYDMDTFSPKSEPDTTINALAMTSSALRNAISLGFDRAGVIETAGLERRIYYRERTSSDDQRLWDGTYYVPARGLTIAIKFRGEVITEFTDKLSSKLPTRRRSWRR